MKKVLGIKIDGVIYKNNENDLTDDEFYDKFIAFIESQGWLFGGGTMEVNLYEEEEDEFDAE